MDQYKRTEFRGSDNSYLKMYDFRYIANEQFGYHYDREARISIVLNGQLKETAGRTEIFAAPFSMVVKPGDVWHSNEFGPKGARLLSVVLPSTLFSSFDEPDFFQHWQWYHANQAAGAISRYLQRLKITDDPFSETVDFLADLSWHRYKGEHSARPDWLKELTDQISDEPTMNYSVQDLASTIGVHPVYLARVFRRHFQCGVKEFIHSNRLKYIIRALTDTHQPLVEVALESGYADQSHMSRFFKQAMGISPGAFRAMVQGY